LSELLVSAAISLFTAALAIYLAVRLIEQVWVALLVIALIVGGIIGLVVVLRWRRRGW